MNIRFFRKRPVVVGIITFALSALVYAGSVSVNGYGGTQSQADTSARNQLISTYPGVTGIAVGNCHRPSYGPPWQCTAYGTTGSSGGSSSGGSCSYESVTGYGGTESQAQQSTYSAWQNTYPSAVTPGLSCSQPSYGPPWQCTATGCVN